MKRISVIFLVMFLIFLSSCSKNNKFFDINYEIYPSKTLSIITDKEKYSFDDTVIRYRITNISNEEGSIPGDDRNFNLEKLVNGEWKQVCKKIDYDIYYTAQILYPNETVQREIKLEDYFYLPLEKGVYRISVDGIVSNSFEIS